MSLRQAISFLAMDAGFQTAEESCLDHLVRLLDSYLVELSAEVKKFVEISGRTKLTLADVIAALESKGTKLTDLAAYYGSSTQHPPPEREHERPPRAFGPFCPEQVEVRPHFVPDHFPAFPPAHTYARTEARINREIDYRQLREKQAVSVMCSKDGLARLMAASAPGEGAQLLPKGFFVIPNKRHPLPYSRALMPKDSLDADDDDDDDTCGGGGAGCRMGAGGKM